MAVLLELVLQGSDEFQETINRFNYTGTSSVPSVSFAAALIQAFGCIWDGTNYPSGLPFRDILEMQNTNISYQFASARNVYSDVDFEEVPFVNDALGRSGAGDFMPPFTAFGFRTNRIRRDIRRGTKRFAGVGEGDQSEGGLFNAGAQGRMGAVATAMSATLNQTVAGVDYTFVPCIVKKERYDPDTGDASSTGRAYRYFPIESDQLENLATAPTWELYETVRSQVSRQYGKGR